MKTEILQKLALERCRVHVSQICAIMHLTADCDASVQHVPDSLHGLFEMLNRDLQLLEDMVGDGC